MKKITLIKGIAVVLFSLSCICLNAQTKKDKPVPESDYFNYSIESMGVGQDGTKVFTIWVDAKNIEKGIELAKRNAVAACLFKGIEASGRTEKTPAIISEGLTDENREFFDDFLMLKDKKGNGGKYLRFVSKSGQVKSEKGKKLYTVSVKVQVAYDDLKTYMINQGKTKSLDFLF